MYLSHSWAGVLPGSSAGETSSLDVQRNHGRHMAVRIPVDVEYED